MEVEPHDQLGADELRRALQLLGHILDERDDPYEIAAAREWFQIVETPTSAFWVNLVPVLQELGHDQ